MVLIVSTGLTKQTQTAEASQDGGITPRGTRGTPTVNQSGETVSNFLGRHEQQALGIIPGKGDRAEFPSLS